MRARVSRRPPPPRPSKRSIGLIAAAVATLAVAGVLAVVALGAVSKSPGPTSTPPQGGVTVQARGGQWTNVSPDRLAQMLGSKDFTLLNVKTPYAGEIEETDLYIPYDRLAASASQLPADKGAMIVVYCRSGVQSAQAAQTLIDLGYTNVWNLEGGMNAWAAAGRTIVNLNR